MKVTVPERGDFDVSDGASALEVLRKALAAADRAVVARVDGALVDLAAPLKPGALVAPVFPEEPDGLATMRHSAAHVLADAVLRLFPGSRLAIGPAIEDGFYYDIDTPRPLTPEDLPAIEAEMQRIAAADLQFVRRELPRPQALEAMQAAGETYKAENIRAADSEVISFYRHGEFEDVCRGPHVPSTGRIGHFRLLSVAGAYWRGDARNRQLQRIYGTAFATAGQLNAYVRRIEEAKKRDHRAVGRQLGIFSIHEEIGPGLVLWHPAGAIIRYQIERFWLEEHLKRGYQLLYSPHIASEKIYQISGHIEKYSELMYSPMDIDGQPYRVKPMNCPGHIMVYQSALRSYRELPLRYCELGTVYRYEPSGTLHGMLRVRGFTQDDSHIFCTRETLTAEVLAILDLVDLMMATFGYRYNAFLATRPPKYLGTEEEWEYSTAALRDALEARGLKYALDEGGGVFYAPKIDIRLTDSLGRGWQGPTIQVDLNLPKRFQCAYRGADNRDHETVIVHRTVLGSMERFVGGLIEHYAGAFPLWLAPEQVRVAPVTSEQDAYARRVLEALRADGIRAALDDRTEKLGYKVREWQLAKVPCLAVAGAREAAGDTVSLRVRRPGKAPLSGQVSLDNLRQTLIYQINRRALWPAETD